MALVFWVLVRINFVNFVLSCIIRGCIIYQNLNDVGHIFLMIVCKNSKALQEDILVWNECNCIKLSFFKIVVIIEAVGFESSPGNRGTTPRPAVESEKVTLGHVQPLESEVIGVVDLPLVEQEPRLTGHTLEQLSDFAEFFNDAHFQVQ